MGLVKSLFQFAQTGFSGFLRQGFWIRKRSNFLTVISNLAILSVVSHRIIRVIDFTIMGNWTEIDWLNSTSKKFIFKLNWSIVSSSQAFAGNLNGLDSMYQWLIKNEFI